MRASLWVKTGLFSALLLTPPLYQASAGFEWVPPSATVQQPAQVQTVPQAVTNQPSTMMPAVAPARVMAEPTMPQTRSNIGITAMPNNQMQQRMPAPMAPIVSNQAMTGPLASQVSAPKTGLYINPYPMQGNNTQAQMVGVDVSMVEQGGGLTPVQLGGGMTSGVMAPPRMDVRDPMQSPTQMNNRPMRISDLTPMVGGEPAPLPLAGVTNNDVMAMPLSSNTQYAKAVGFGKELPLALALSQVVPSEFSYRFDGDVDTDTNVSWDGGQSWNVVLDNMLRPHNLRASIQSNQVVITPSARI